jgi:excisionase family DNA binding protein
MNQITTSRAARVLELSENMVRVLADRGQLPCTRVGSLRVFNLDDVLRVRAARAARGSDRHERSPGAPAVRPR